MRAYTVDGLGRSSYIDIEDPAPPATQEAATVPATAAPQPAPTPDPDRPPELLDPNWVHDDLNLSQRPKVQDDDWETKR